MQDFKDLNYMDFLSRILNTVFGVLFPPATIGMHNGTQL